MAIHSDRRDHIGILTIDRAEVRNAMDSEHSAIVGGVLDDWEHDDDVWVVIVTGAGDQAFSAGMDLKARHAANRTGGPSNADAPPASTASKPWSRGNGFAGITHRGFPKPLIAAVNGVAMGGGFELCLACDMVIAEEHARFALSEVKRGLFAGAGGVERLVRCIPPALAAEYIMTGDFITAHRAFELGLVNRIAPTGSGLDVAIELAERIVQNSPFAVKLSKEVMRASLLHGEAEMEGLVGNAIRRLMASEDMREGVAAFSEKRPPRWTGR